MGRWYSKEMIENLLLMRQMMMLKVYHVAEFYSSLFDQSLLVLDFPLYEYFHFGKMLMAIGGTCAPSQLCPCDEHHFNELMN